MAMLADIADAVIGVDTHTDTHTACLLDRLGRQLAVITVPAEDRGVIAHRMRAVAGIDTENVKSRGALPGVRTGRVGPTQSGFSDARR